MAWRSAIGRPIGVTILAAILVWVVAGAGAAGTPGPAIGGTVRMGLVEGGPAALVGGVVADPAVFSTGWLWRCCLARTLLAYPGLPTSEGGTVLHPDLAADHPTISSDGLLWTFRIRPGIRYQPPFDDRAVAAADVIRAIERSVRVTPSLVDPGFPFHHLDGAARYARGEASVISGLQSADPMSLSFRLTSPDGAFGHHLTDPATAPIPEGVSDGLDPVVTELDPTSDDPPPPPEVPFAPRFVSSGPYMYASYPADTAGGRVALVRNPSWDAATDPLRRPLPDHIEIVTAPTREDALAMLERGELDLLPATLDVVERYRRDPELAPRLLQTPTEVIAFVPMNLAVPPFDDVAVRRAANLAVDRPALMEAHVEGRSRLPWMGGLRSDTEVVTHVFADSLTAGLLVAYDPFPSPGGRGDVAAARAEMRASRYDTDGDGICDAPACRDVTVVAAFPEIGEVLRDGLSAVGIEAQVVPRNDEVDMGDPANRTAIQADWWQWAYGLHGDLNELLRGGAALSGEGPTYNMSLVGASPDQLADWGYAVTSVPSVDDLLDGCEQELGHRRATCWAQLDQLLSEAIVPWIPMYRETASWVLSSRVVSVKLDQAAFAVPPALERTVVAGDVDDAAS